MHAILFGLPIGLIDIIDSKETTSDSDDTGNKFAVGQFGAIESAGRVAFYGFQLREFVGKTNSYNTSIYVV